MYPDNVAYPFGGEGYIMIELHYDNPHEIEGNIFFPNLTFSTSNGFRQVLRIILAWDYGTLKLQENMTLEYSQSDTLFIRTMWFLQIPRTSYPQVFWVNNAQRM